MSGLRRCWQGARRKSSITSLPEFTVRSLELGPLRRRRRLLTPQVLMAQARRYLQPGAIMLGHANHPTVTELFGQIEARLRQRNLTPVTLDEMFGTSRQTG